MKLSLSTLLAAALVAILGLTISSGAEPAGQSVLSYHADPGRSGNFIVPSLTWDRASSLQLDGNFRPRISGHVYAQPLYWRGSESSSGVLLVATEDNIVHRHRRGERGREMATLARPACAEVVAVVR
jgi:hypothetical protein